MGKVLNKMVGESGFFSMKVLNLPEGFLKPIEV